MLIGTVLFIYSTYILYSYMYNLHSSLVSWDCIKCARNFESLKRLNNHLCEISNLNSSVRIICSCSEYARTSFEEKQVEAMATTIPTDCTGQWRNLIKCDKLNVFFRGLSFANISYVSRWSCEINLSGLWNIAFDNKDSNHTFWPLSGVLSAVSSIDPSELIPYKPTCSLWRRYTAVLWCW